MSLSVQTRKVLSRSRERYRNEKYVSCGLGRVLESADSKRLAPSQIVAFLAPSHPPCAERIVLTPELMCEADEFSALLNDKSILYQPLAPDGQRHRWWSCLNGWSRYSGKQILPELYSSVMHNVLETIRGTDWRNTRCLCVDQKDAVQEVRERPLTCPPTNRKKAVLFGYGNYAKTNIIPNVSPYISISCIHEIDPTQIPADGNFTECWDTSLHLRSTEQYDVYLIAGFHHTHAPLAINALNHNAYAVVEKPIVVDNSQLVELLKAMRNSNGQLFCCFHKRYLPFNKLAVQDMDLYDGRPVSYHCIVYEVPLPKLHWYRWPNSKSRLVSNGCHWIDHFLYLNGFCRVQSADLTVADDGTVNCSVILDNGALFTMVLTDRGSRRIGVRDYIELHTDNITVKMTDGYYYIAENKDRIIRRARINKMRSYRAMYQQIGKAINQG